MALSQTCNNGLARQFTVYLGASLAPEPLISEGALISTSTQITPRNPQIVGAEESEVAVPSLSLRDLIQVLRRRKSTALITFSAVATLVVVAALLAKAQYLSMASLLLENQGAKPNISEVSDILAPQGGMAVESQVQLLNSPLILDEVYRQTKIDPGSVNVAVNRVEQTTKIEITGISQSPEDAQKFVAMVPKVYQQNRRDERAREVKSELAFAKSDLAQENQKLLDTEAAIVAFKQRNDLINPDSEAQDAISRAASARSNLQASRADITSLRAQIGALEQDLAALSPRIDTPVVTTNPQIEALRNDLANLQSKRKDQLFNFKENDDSVRQIDQQIATLKARIAATPPTVTNNSNAPNPAVADTRNRIAGLNADLSAKEAATQVLEQQVVQLEAGLGRYAEIQRKQQQLQREFDASTVAVRVGKEKVRQLGGRATALQAAGAPITVLVPGTPAIKIAPNPARNIIVGLFVAAILACAAALLQDSLDDRVRDEEEARQLLGAPVLGYFPLLPVSDERQILDMNNPNRLLLETFRALRSNVQFALVNSAGKKLQVTSTVPNEGKSYIASNLAITMALDGRRVILVDADLHRPTMHERFGAKRQPGLTNVLVGQITALEALQEVGIENLRLMSAGALPPNPAELLNSPAMAQVMRELELHADLIIFDTPPLLATSDSQLMSAKMDGVVFVMQMGSVARSGTVRAFELLKQAHANLIGVVFNKVDAGKNSVGYENYGGYYALDANVPDDEILTIPAKPLTSGEHVVTNETLSNGTVSNEGLSNGLANGSAKNGSHENGSHGQSTVFDEALRSDKNSS